MRALSRGRAAGYQWVEQLEHCALLHLRAVRTEAADGNEPAAENGKTLDIYEWYV